MRAHRIVFIGTMVAAVVLATPAAYAGLDGDPNAYNDGSTIWSGRVAFRGVMMGFLWNAADVEYCVYAPGAFEDSWGQDSDPSNGLHYVYAYQIFNDLDPYPDNPAEWPGASRHISTLSVGLNGGDEEAANIGQILSTGDVPADMDDSGINPTSVFWDFIDGSILINYGQTSNVLFFTSLGVPELDTATLSGEVPDVQDLPSPSTAPEPATLVILAIAAVGLLKAKRGRKV